MKNLSKTDNGLLIAQAATDRQVIDMFLWNKSRKSKHTEKAYFRYLNNFINFVGKPVNEITLKDLQTYAQSLIDKAPRTQNLMISCVKSFFSFAHRIGYAAFNVGAALEVARVDENLNEKILTEEEIFRILAATNDFRKGQSIALKTRDYILLRLLYVSKVRVSELVSLCWKDVTPRPEKNAGQISVMGKGSKRRNILLSPGTWQSLRDLRRNSGDDMPVFQSQKPKGAALSRQQVYRIVAKYAKIAKIDKKVSPHWFRHSGASHALDRQCPIHVLREDLGHESLATTTKYVHARPETGSAEYMAL